MTTYTSACKNCTSYTDRRECTKGTTFLTDQITKAGERIATFPFRNSVCAQHEMRNGLSMAFYVRPTTCADCFHFCEEPIEFDDEVIPAGCGNDREVLISADTQSCRHIQADDQPCEEHATEGEVEFENKNNRESIEREAAAAARQAEASAERITMQVLGKLRKGGAL